MHSGSCLLSAAGETCGMSHMLPSPTLLPFWGGQLWDPGPPCTLLSSMTVLRDSIHMGSMSPSRTIHLGPS